MSSEDAENKVSRRRSTPSSSAVRAIRRLPPQSHLDTLIQRAADLISLRPLIDLVRNMNLVPLARMVMRFIKEHRWQIAGLIVGIVLIANPLAILGFGAAGPVLGSIAAAWQAAIGNVVAGSLFAFLQSAGMVYAVTIPLVGVGVVGGVVASVWRWFKGRRSW